MSTITSHTSQNSRSKSSSIWKSYYTLYMHYAYGTPMPFYFPKAILDEFPDRSYREELKKAIATMQSDGSNDTVRQKMILTRN